MKKFPAAVEAALQTVPGWTLPAHHADRVRGFRLRVQRGVGKATHVGRQAEGVCADHVQIGEGPSNDVTGPCERCLGEIQQAANNVEVPVLVAWQLAGFTVQLL